MKKLFTVFVVLALLAIGSNSLVAKVKVGEEVLERFESAHPYEGKKGVVWEKEFYYPEAGYIAIHFAEFDLAKGDILEIFDPEGSRYLCVQRERKKDQKPGHQYRGDDQ